MYTIPYGRTELTFSLPDGVNPDLINPPETVFPVRDITAVKEALDHPLGERRLADFKGAQNVVIAVNDKTRPVPYGKLLPPLLDALKQIGIDSKKICFLVATGTHTPATEQDIRGSLPAEIYENYKVISHDCDDNDNLIKLGDTSRGTPVYLNKIFHAADLKILVGDIEPHHFAGFSGGCKTASIGLTGRATINANHAMLIDPRSTIAEVETNPLRQDIDEIGKLTGAHFALNAILNVERGILQAFFGAPELVYQSGVRFAREICQTKVDRSYDLVIASTGGYPKDINFYQAQKGFAPSVRLVKENGVIILAAECEESIGSQGYENFLSDVNSHQQVVEKFKKTGFIVGPHKALMISIQARHARIILVSGLPEAKVKKCLLEYAPTIEQAIQMANFNPTTQKVAILAHAINTIPVVSSKA